MTAHEPLPGTLVCSHRPADTSRAVKDSTIGRLLTAAAADAADVTALVAGGPEADGRRRWTYRELHDDARRVAAALLCRFAPGERVACGRRTFPNGSYSSTAPPWRA